MTLLGEMLFPPADYRRTTLSLIGWWESRRLTYNVVVGTTGLVTIGFVRVISIVLPGLPMQFDWQPVVAYGVLANVCYTFGWAVEVALQRVLRNRAPAIGPALFRQGLAFSVGLTLLPTLVTSLAWVARLIFF